MKTNRDKAFSAYPEQLAQRWKHMKNRTGKTIITLFAVIALLIGIMPFANRTVEAKETKTVVWNYDILKGISITEDSLGPVVPVVNDPIKVYGEFGEDDILYFNDSEDIGMYIKLMNASLNFETSFGVITGVDITAAGIIVHPDGWSVEEEQPTEGPSYYHVKWSGSSKTVSLCSKGGYTDEILIGDIQKITFTVETVDVTGITIEPSPFYTYETSGSQTLTATVSPENATYKDVVWSSDDIDVVNGTFIPYGWGVHTITATATNGTDDTSDDKSAQCTVIISPNASIIKDEHKPKAREGLTATGSDIELVSAPSSIPHPYEKIEYSLDNKDWSEKIPTGSQIGEYWVTYRYMDADGVYPALLSPWPEDVTIKNGYRVKSGDGSSWTRGSAEGLSISFQAVFEDDKTFERCSGVNIDDSSLDDSSYSKSPGSVVILLSPEYLETLSVGRHTMTVSFSDSYPVTASFTVKDKSSGSGGSSSSTSLPFAIPKTGIE